MSKKETGGIFSSLIGMLIGLGLVIALSPYLLWQSQSQHRADDFSSAEQVESSSDVDGYVVVEDEAKQLETLICPRQGDNLASLINNSKTDSEDEEEFLAEEADEDDDVIDALENAGFEFEEIDDETKDKKDKKKEEKSEPQDCLYVYVQNETYSRKEERVCGDTSDDQKIIEHLEDECDDEGNCEHCYLVESFDWNGGDSSSEFASFTVGSYQINPSSKAKFVGTSSLVDYQFPDRKNTPNVGDKRFNYTYMPSNNDTLIVGNASDQKIEGALDDKIFVISSKSYAGTLEALQNQDKSSGRMLWIFSLIAMLIGMLLVVGPLTLLTDIFKVIPFFGKHADKGFDGMIKFGAILAGLVLWGIVYVFVLLAKNILLILGVLAVIGILIFVVATKGKSKLKKSE